MVTLGSIRKFFGRVGIQAALISVIVSIAIWFPTYYVAQEQNQRLKEQNTILSQQILLMNETLKLQKTQNQILQESLVRKPVVTVNVYPAWEWYYTKSSNGTIRFEKMPMAISRDTPTVFHVYISNVGTGVTQLFYLGIFAEIQTPSQYIVSMPNAQDLGGKVLKPYDTVNVTYAFDPMAVWPQHQTTNLGVGLTFAVMSTNTTDYCVIRFVIRY